MRLPKPCLSVLILVLSTSVVAQQTPTATESTAVQAAVPATSSTPAAVKPNSLLDGTPVKLRIGRNVSSADAKVGEHVDFEVLDEVQVMGVVVIAKGATASATVTDAQAKRRMGRAGKLDLNLDYVRLVDNEKAALTATAGGKGGSHTGAMIGAMAATAIFTLGGSALFLLMHGKDITIPKGAETTAYINGDMHLDMAKFVASPQASTPLLVAEAASLSPASAQASLVVDSTPSGADIEIDGAFVGNTPSTVSVASGVHDISVKKKGFAGWAKKLNVSAGSIHLNADLDALRVAQ
jgi:hypothetical protein